MDKDKWLRKFNIPKNSEVIFYQNPKFFRTNTFKREYLDKEFSEYIKQKGYIKIYTITGITNNHYKNGGRRLKICLVKELLITK